MRILAALVFVLSASGCASVMQATVVDKAAFDLECPAAQVSTVNLGYRSYGATGCEKRITYVLQGECSTRGSCRAVKEEYEVREASQSKKP